MKIFLFVLVVTMVAPGYAEETKLTEQSTQLKAALEKINSGGTDDFVRWFPKNRAEFDETCNSPKFDQLYDCHEVFSPGVEKALLAAPNELGTKLATLASEVEYSADAPNYLQSAWKRFCSSNPKAFSYSISKLDPKSQNQAFKYMTKGIEFDSNSALELCANSLKKAGFEKLSKIALKNRVKVNKHHH